MALTSQDLLSSPRFVVGLKSLADQLQVQFDGNPRLSRLLASQQRWILSQAAFALHIEYDPQVGGSGLTTTRLKEMILSVNAASRNTVLNFLDQLISYRFMRVATEGARRPRRFEATDISVNAMFAWFATNLGALDLVDGGNRLATLMDNRDIFRLAQPMIARRCIADSNWREPPPRVAMFLWTESGGLVMDELIRRVDLERDGEGELLNLGRVDARAMAEHFMMSRTHLQRLLRKAVESGCLVWHDPVRKTHMRMTRDYLEEYCGWQAVKFSIVDQSFEEAAQALGLAATREGAQARS